MSINRDAIFHPRNKALWYLLALQGGLVNVGGFLEVGHFVSHVTGFSGHLVLDIFHGNFLSALFFALIPFAFLIGSIVSGYLTEVRRRHDKSPVYIHILTGMALIYFSLALLGANDLLPDFGSGELTLKTASIMALLCGTCGAQNALFTSASGAVVRTTHLTGLFTDFGIGLAKVFSKVDYEHEKRSTKLRAGLIFSFLLGSVLGAWLFLSLQHLAWLIPTLISLFMAIQLFKTRKHFEAIFPDHR